MGTTFRYIDEREPVAPPDPRIDLRVDFRVDKDGQCAVLVAPTADGHSWHIVGFLPNGRLHRHWRIPKSLGLPLDTQGRVLLDEEPAVVEPTAELTLLRDFVTALAGDNVSPFADSIDIPFILGPGPPLLATEHCRVAGCVLERIEKMKDAPA